MISFKTLNWMNEKRSLNQSLLADHKFQLDASSFDGVELSSTSLISSIFDFFFCHIILIFYDNSLTLFFLLSKISKKTRSGTFVFTAKLSCFGVGTEHHWCIDFSS